LPRRIKTSSINNFGNLKSYIFFFTEFPGEQLSYTGGFEINSLEICGFSATHLKINNSTNHG